MAKLIVLRRPDSCVACASHVPAGTWAYWFSDESVVRCSACVEGDTVSPIGSAASVTGVAGASARREGDKRSTREKTRAERLVRDDEAWRERIKHERPVLGRFVAAMTPRPEARAESQSTRSWKIGSVGEEQVAESLCAVPGIHIIHDRQVPGPRANIDHIVIAPSGVYVIDAKKYTGRIEFRGLLRNERRLYVGGRNRTELADRVQDQVNIVRLALGPDHADVPVHGVLCFVDGDWGWIIRPQRLDAVHVLWPSALAQLVASDGVLDDHLVASMTRQLTSQLAAA